MKKDESNLEITYDSIKKINQHIRSLQDDQRYLKLKNPPRFLLDDQHYLDLKNPLRIPVKLIVDYKENCLYFINLSCDETQPLPMNRFIKERLLVLLEKVEQKEKNEVKVEQKEENEAKVEQKEKSEAKEEKITNPTIKLIQILKEKVSISLKPDQKMATLEASISLKPDQKKAILEVSISLKPDQKMAILADQAKKEKKMIIPLYETLYQSLHIINKKIAEKGKYKNNKKNEQLIAELSTIKNLILKIFKLNSQ